MTHSRIRSDAIQSIANFVFFFSLTAQRISPNEFRSREFPREKMRKDIERHDLSHFCHTSTTTDARFRTRRTFSSVGRNSSRTEVVTIRVTKTTWTGEQAHASFRRVIRALLRETDTAKEREIGAAVKSGRTHLYNQQWWRLIRPRVIRNVHSGLWLPDVVIHPRGVKVHNLF